MYTQTTTLYGNDEGTPTLINWRAIFGGAVIGIGMLVLLSGLWLALAFPSGQAFVRDNLAWFLGGTAIFALFVAGYLAGVISGARGLGAGLVQALTLWALVIVAVLAVGVPAVLRVLNINQAITDTGLAGDPLWAAFWSMLIALGACLLGGILGGATPRRAAMPVAGVTPTPAVPAPTRPEPVADATESPTRTDRSRRPRRVS